MVLVAAWSAAPDGGPVLVAVYRDGAACDGSRTGAGRAPRLNVLAVTGPLPADGATSGVTGPVLS